MDGAVKNKADIIRVLKQNSDVDFYIEIKPEFKTLNKFIGKHIVNQVEYVSLAA